MENGEYYSDDKSEKSVVLIGRMSDEIWNEIQWLEVVLCESLFKEVVLLRRSLGIDVGHGNSSLLDG